MNALYELDPKLKDLLLTQYGKENFDRILEGYSARRFTSFRVNTLKASPPQIEEILNEMQIPWQHPKTPTLAQAFILPPGFERQLRDLRIYEAGEIYLQNLSAMLPALILNPQAEENILDMAAAPGGKTTQMAALSGDKALICACEKNSIRAQKLRYNLEKQAAVRVNVMECDARKLDDFFSFDKILLDAPCSGTGTLQLWQKPRKKGFFSDLLTRSIKTQRALLRKALQILKPKGLLVYATCSLLVQENEEILRPVLESQEASLEPLPEALLEGIEQLPCQLKHAALICPNEHFEGFFFAALRKKG